MSGSNVLNRTISSKGAKICPWLERSFPSAGLPTKRIIIGVESIVNEGVQLDPRTQKELEVFPLRWPTEKGSRAKGNEPIKEEHENAICKRHPHPNGFQYRPRVHDGRQ